MGRITVICMCIPYHAKALAQESELQPAQTFNPRCAVIGVSDTAALDDGATWPEAFALQELIPDVEDAAGMLAKQA